MPPAELAPPPMPPAELAPPMTPTPEVVEAKPVVVPTEFDAITTQLHGEQDLASRDKLKFQAASALRPALDALAPTEVPDYLRNINESYGGVFSGLDLCLLSTSRENIVIVNTRGELEELSVTAENSRDVLLAVKAADAERQSGHSYALRHEILKRSAGKILSHEAYTYGQELPKGGELDSYLDSPENWIEERRQVHEGIVTTELINAHQLSERLGDNKSTLYALRGNTAAGKTTAVRTTPAFSKALDEHGEPSGSINPDTYKGELKAADAEDGVQTLSHEQTHEEGSMIARSINRELAASESSMVIDKRMSKEKNIKELIALAEKSGREIKILDVDVPLELSVVRVLEREVGGEAPNVPFHAIADGFKQIRESRQHLLEQVMTDDKITDYVLRAADSSGKSQEVARKVDGQLIVEPEHADLFNETLRTETSEQTIATVAETVITDEYIESYIGRIHGDNPTSKWANASREALVHYKGKTLKQAIDERAGTLNE